MVKAIKNWKPIELDANIFTGSIDGLVGIEECTDYDLNEYKKGHNDKKKEKVSTKSKSIKKAKASKEQNSQLIEFSPSKSGTTLDKNEHSVEIEENLNNVVAWSNFGLPKELLQGLSALDFQQPTQIQTLTLPAAILGRKNILGAAETGSGKTLAFGLPILTGILKCKEKESKSQTESNSDSESEEEFELDTNGLGCVKSEKHPYVSPNGKPLYALILTPTRELAMQVSKHLTAVAKFTGIKIAVVVGGMASVKQERLLNQGPEIVVATPGRLWELIQSGNPHLSQIDNIKFLAIDETDRMLERGHFQELHDLLERINIDEEKKKQRQNFVFSATLTLVHELPQHLITKSKVKRTRKIKEMTPAQKLQKIVDMLGIYDPKIVDITEGKGTSGTLTECRITCDIEEKDYYVYYFLQKHSGRTLIFCNSIGCVKRLTTLLNLLKCNTLPLHATMAQRQRLKNLERFTNSENGVLIATDVAARGLDIPSVEHVLHYQTPRTTESYVHRSGRTARASKEGITVLLVEPSELSNYLKLCRTLGKSEDIPIFPVEERFLNAVKQRVNLARELDKLELTVKKTNSEAGWFQKAAQDMDIVIDDNALKYDTAEAKKVKKVADVKRKQLSSLLDKPIFPKGYSSRYPINFDSVSLGLLQGEQKKENAVEVMKNALEEYAKDKKKFIPLFKSRRDKQKTHEKVVKLSKFKNSNKKFGKGKRRK